jgi:hypothetical protein
MDRVIVYPGALPQDTDILTLDKSALVAQAYQNLAVLGSATVVAGLACTPTSPTPDLHVTVGVGSIYQMDPTDAAAYGSLGIDNNNIMKQGILATPAVLSITPPSTAGFSQVFLVQAILNDVDAGSLVLSYYNASNPASPFAGPANSGTSNFTTRTNPCAIGLKAGVAATTGTQTTPSPDAGFVGLYAVTVANGQTQITSSSIAQLNTAPFFPTLPGVPTGVRNGTWVWGGSDTGAANAYVITIGTGVGLTAVPTAYVIGMGVRFKATNANSGAGGSTINVNGLGLVAIKRAGGATLAAGDILSGQVVSLIYDGVNFQMENYLGISGSQTVTNNTVGLPYVVDTGAANALIGTYSPAVGAYVAGLALTIKLANPITGGSTINVNGLGVKNILLGDLTPTQPNMFVTGEVLLIIYDGTQFQLYGYTSGTYRKPLANTTLFVNAGTGNDTTLDGTSATVSGSKGPFATIGKAVRTAFGYAPSQFTITVSVAPGTYNENVATPAYAGPNILIDGGSAATTHINGGAGHCFSVAGPNTLTVNNFDVVNNGVYPNCGFICGQGSTLNTNNTTSGVCSIVFNAGSGATLFSGTHTFNASGYAAWYSSPGGIVVLTNVTYTFSTAVSYGNATVVAGGGGVGINNVNPPVFTNPSFVNASKYNVLLNGTISANGLGVNFLPGNSAGTTSLGGQVQF